MRRALQFAALLLAAGCDSKPSELPYPRAHVEVAQHDFGPLWIGEVRQVVFRVENRGRTPLVLDPVRSSCGCLVARIDPKRIEPGHASELTVELHADKGPMALEKGLFIGSNDPQHEWLPFVLKATTRTLYECDPPLLDLPQIVLGDVADHAIALRVADGTPIVFGAPQVPERGFSAALSAVTPTSATLTVRFDGDALPGRRLFHIVVPTDHPLVKELRMPVQAIVVARLVADPPDLVDFGTIERAQGAKRSVTIRRRSQTAFAARPTARVELGGSRAGQSAPTAPTGDAPAVTASLEEVVAGDEWRLDLTVAPGTPATSLVGRVVVRLELPNEPPLSLTLTGRITEPR
ncbi:MAG: DUF1573 domain-containing protein [Planctomycetes bacterium]|nr:DUF1573 domain-containing protein [Planctomycetota bacterium]